MADRNEKVYERVLQELGKNPGLGSRELYDVAKSVEKDIGRDSLQQFHARYVLPAKRARKSSDGSAPAKRAGRPRKKSVQQTQTQAQGAGQPQVRRRRPGSARQLGADRDRVRALLLQFAQELTDAESRSSLVQVLAKVDSYVDRIAGVST